jgi:hypothetical protein
MLDEDIENAFQEESDVEMESGDEQEEAKGNGSQDEWGGISNQPVEGGGSDDHIKTGKKPPTAEELRAIKDASDLFKSSSFKLQVCIHSHFLKLTHSFRSMHYFPTFVQNLRGFHLWNASSSLCTPGLEKYHQLLLNILLRLLENY